MIAQLVGKITDKTDTTILLETDSGIIFEICCPENMIEKINIQPATIRIYTYLHLREDQMTLFGFLTRDELTLFRYLISVSDIGPKKALTILSKAPFETIRDAIASSDIRFLSSIPGVGKKTAEKIIFELRDKISTIKEYCETTVGGIDISIQKELYSALINLGYKSTQAEKAIANLKKMDNNDFNALFKEALNIIKSL